jgi:aspartate aminotransferase
VANLQKIPLSSDALADYFLQEAGVALLSRTAFGKFGEGNLRLSYANSLEKIDATLARIQTAIQKLSL